MVCGLGGYGVGESGVIILESRVNYEFEGCNNPQCPDRGGKKQIRCVYVLPYAMGQAPKVGEQIPCPGCGTGLITRIFSTGVGLIVRQPAAPDIGGGSQSFMTNINGQDTKITFVDHAHTDAAYQEGLVRAAKQAGIGGAYFNEKQGRVCVDVESNRPDPLGMISRERGPTTVTRVNTPVKVQPRKNVGPRRPISRAEASKMRMPVRKGI